jgi:hypothetical protein
MNILDRLNIRAHHLILGGDAAIVAADEDTMVLLCYFQQKAASTGELCVELFLFDSKNEGWVRPLFLSDRECMMREIL